MLTPNTHDVFIPAGEINDALCRVKYAICQEKTRYYLNGVFVHYDAKAGGIYFVATNGHVLARVLVKTKTDHAAMPAVILPEEFVAAVIKATSKRKHQHYAMRMQIATTRVEYAAPEGDAIEAKPINGTFPNYMLAIPRGHTFAPEINRKAFLLACESLAGFHNYRNKIYARVKLQFAGSCLTMTAQIATSEDVAGEAKLTLPLTKTVPEAQAGFVIGFNPHYLANSAKALQGKTVQLQITDPGSPANIICTDACDANALHVVMPCSV